MPQTIELTLDDELDSAVRAEWDVLASAGLPSQALHLGITNAPHVTLGVASALDAGATGRIAAVTLPDQIRLGGLLVFRGRRSSVVSRAVIPSAALLATHAAVDEAMAGAPGRPDLTLPGRWTPHVTLARRLDDAGLSQALDLLADVPRELVGAPVELRHWDSDAKAVHVLRTR
ncbi:2'-5' RNA ligase family protein [Aeromicrobium sp. Leaf350]|uniref:2'-5' RNA ligase family protein n=1 Tax=Aeromicrobium sp. Leaf350 TaxID=2876565 RepID=UPI001E50A281|nr:2'-5' RNA ligase family protein [Aeromicrobium sp. Leaf350]